VGIVRSGLAHRAAEGRRHRDEMMAAENRTEGVGDPGARRFGRAEFVVGAAPAGIETRLDDGIVFSTEAFEPARMDPRGGVAAQDRIDVGRVGTGDAK